MFMDKIPEFKPDDKIFFIRSAFLGDWLATLPFVEYLIYRYKLNPTQIYFLIFNNKKLNPAELILGKENIFAKNTIVVNSNASQIVSSILEARALVNQVYSVDHVLLLPFTRDLYYSVIKKWVICKFIFGVNPFFSGFNLHFDTKIFSTSQYLSIFEKYGIQTLDVGNQRTFLFAKNRSQAIDISGKKRVALYVHSKLSMKIWPKHKYVELILNIHKDVNCDFFLIGASEDHDYNLELLELVSRQNAGVNIENLAGKMSIPETLHFFLNINILIGNEGAPMHIASLVNLPTVAIFTYKEPIGTWDPPKTDDFVSIRSDVSCKNCFKEFCHNPVCIYDVKVETVLMYSKLIIENKLNGIHSVVELNRVPRSCYSLG